MRLALPVSKSVDFSEDSGSFFSEDSGSFCHFEIDSNNESVVDFLDRCQRHLEAYGGRIIIELENTSLTVEQVRNHFRDTGYTVEDKYNGFVTGKVLVGEPVLGKRTGNSSHNLGEGVSKAVKRIT